MSSYEIKKLHDKLDKCELHIQRIKEVIAGCEKMDFVNLVTWEDLSDWEIGEKRNVSETLNIKLVHEDNIMIFKTIIPKHFNKHWHNFIEQNYLIKGRLKDCKRTYDTGDWMKYEILEPHCIDNLSNEPAEIIVIFTR